MTARQVHQAQAAREELQQQYNDCLCRVHAHILDVKDEASCLALAEYVSKYKGFHNANNSNNNQQRNEKSTHHLGQ